MLTGISFWKGNCRFIYLYLFINIYLFMRLYSADIRMLITKSWKYIDNNKEFWCRTDNNKEIV